MVCKSTQVESHLCLFEKVTYSGARAILPVYCTTPTVALLKEANILPAEIELERLSQAAAVRTTRLDPRHPLHKCAEWIRKENRATSRFTRKILVLLQSENINPIAQPL